MSRSVIAGLMAVLLVALLCICGIGAFFIAGGSAATALLQETFNEVQGTPATTLAQPPASTTAEDAPATTEETPTEAQPVTQVGPTPTPIPLPQDALAIVRAEEQLLAALYENVGPGVVNIDVTVGNGSTVEGAGQGSGWVWDAQGYIVTNNHVVENATSIVVNFPDNLQFDAEVVGTDPDSDLAVIRVDAGADVLRPLSIGNSTDLRVGQRVVAIGNPFGFEGTLTSGVVSAVGRAIPGQTLAPGGVGSFSMPNLIQTDTAINPGNSGGPLLDIEGRVIGVNTLIYSRSGSNSGVGFAIPVDKVKAVVPAIIEQGFYETPYLGISSLPVGLTAELAEQLQLQNVTSGILVQEVTEGGPAEQAGLRGGTRTIELEGVPQPVPTGGDVIVAIDGQRVVEFDDLINYLDTLTVGDMVTLSVIREGEPQDIQVTLGARPRSAPAPTP